MNDRYTADTINDNALDQLYDRLDRAQDAAALHRQGLITTAELYAVIEATPESGPAGTEGTEPDEEHNLVHALGGDRTAETIAHTLTVHGHTLDAVRTMTYAELLAVPGIGGPSLARIRESLDGWPDPEGTDQVEIGDIQITRKLGHGLIVDTAPRHTRMALALLNMPSYGAGVVNASQINIADQVLYQVTGYDPQHAALLLELVEDWRPKPKPEPAATCTATWTTHSLGLARCTQPAGHYGPGLPGKELRHQGRTPDGSRWEWTDEESGATAHEEQP